MPWLLSPVSLSAISLEHPYSCIALIVIIFQKWGIHMSTETNKSLIEEAKAKATELGFEYEEDEDGLHLLKVGKDKEHIEIPEGFTIIRGGAFTDCKSLKKVVFPSTISLICYNAFSKHAMVSIKIKSSVPLKIIGGAFGDMETVESVYLEAPKLILNADAISRANSLKKVRLIGALEISGRAFGKTKIDLLELSCPFIPDWAFCEADIRSIRFLSDVDSIGRNAFANIESLEEIIWPNAVRAIGDGAFEGVDNMVEFPLPFHMEEFGESTITGQRLERFVAPNGIDENTPYRLKNGSLWHIDEEGRIDGLALFPSVVTATKLNLPWSNIFGRSFFAGNETVEKAIFENAEVIPACFFRNSSALTYFECQSASHVGGDAFCYCENLETVVLPSVTYVGDSAFCHTSIAEIPNEKSIKTIEASAFGYCSNLRKANLLSLYRTVPRKAFYNCYDLEEVILGEEVEAIEEEAFANCKNLRRVVIKSNFLLRVAENAFEGCRNIREFVVEKPYDIFFENGLLLRRVESRLDVINIFPLACKEALHIPDGVTTIKEGAFKYSKNIKDIFVPKSVTCIETWAFYECTADLHFEIPGDATTLPLNVSGFSSRCFEGHLGKIFAPKEHYDFDPSEGSSEPLTDREVRDLKATLVRGNPKARYVVSNTWWELIEAHCRSGDALGSRRFNLALIANGPFQSTCGAEIRAVVGDVLYLIYQNDVIKVPLGESYRFQSGVYQSYCPEYTSISLVSL